MFQTTNQIYIYIYVYGGYNAEMTGISWERNQQIRDSQQIWFINKTWDINKLTLRIREINGGYNVI